MRCFVTSRSKIVVSITMLTNACPKIAYLERCVILDKQAFKWWQSICFRREIRWTRILLHKKASQIKLFSRKGLDHTHEYLGFFAKFVSENILVDECILDGELLAWDQDAGRFNEFMSNMKGLFNHYLGKNENTSSIEFVRNGTLTKNFSGMWPCYSIFDVLYINTFEHKPCDASFSLLGQDGNRKEKFFHRNMLPTSLAERKKTLKRIIKPVPNKFCLTPYTILEKSHMVSSLKYVQIIQMIKY